MSEYLLSVAIAVKGVKMLMEEQYETVSVERPPAIQGQTAEVIAMGVKMLIDPVSSFENPQAANERPQLARFRADVLDTHHTGVSDIKKFDILYAPDTDREFLIVERLEAFGTDVLQLELEARKT